MVSTSDSGITEDHVPHDLWSLQKFLEMLKKIKKVRPTFCHFSLSKLKSSSLYQNLEEKTESHSESSTKTEVWKSSNDRSYRIKKPKNAFRVGRRPIAAFFIQEIVRSTADNSVCFFLSSVQEDWSAVADLVAVA